MDEPARSPTTARRAVFHDGSRVVLRRLMTNAGALALGGIVAQAAFLMVEALIARHVGLLGYGIYSSSYVLIMLMSHLVDMGTYWKLVQDGARDPGTLSSNLGTMIVARVGIFLVAYPLVLAFLWLLRGDSPDVRFFALFAFFGIQVATHDLLSGVHTARQRMVLGAVFQAAVPLAVLAVFALLVIPQPTLPRLAGAFILGSGLVTTIWVWQVWRRERPRVSFGAIVPILRDCLHYGISGLMWNTYLRMGTLVLTFFSVAEQVALFAAAFKLIDLFFKIAVLGNRVVAPQLYADSHHSPASFTKVSEVTLRLTVVAGTVGALVLYLSGTWIVTLVYGAGFAASGGILSVLGVSLMLKTVALTAQTIISAADDHTQRVRVITFMTVIAFALAVPCALSWGAIGVAYAVMGSDIVLTALLLWRVRRTICIDNLRALLLLPLLSAVVCALAASRLDAHALLQVLGALLMFAAVLWSSGYVRPGKSAASGNAVSSRKKR